MNKTGYFILLPDILVKQLENIPETGMGYHVVDLKLRDGTTRYKRTIINGCELQLLCNHENIYSTDIQTIIPR